ncbi:MAG: hypothetical protein D6798_04620 [Deltaproteobacteria bacterium]|nr:MAG: hypothetical protein D6798_04620 [Deltaproteobacteria bacterium]
MLDLLVELGHLDDRLLQIVNDRLLDLTPAPGPEGTGPVHPIDLATLKRVAAQVIQENIDDADPEYRRALEREWPLLFH